MEGDASEDEEDEEDEDEEQDVEQQDVDDELDGKYADDVDVEEDRERPLNGADRSHRSGHDVGDDAEGVDEEEEEEEEKDDQSRPPEPLSPRTSQHTQQRHRLLGVRERSVPAIARGCGGRA